MQLTWYFLLRLLFIFCIYFLSLEYNIYRSRHLVYLDNYCFFICLEQFLAKSKDSTKSCWIWMNCFHLTFSWFSFSLCWRRDVFHHTYARSSILPLLIIRSHRQAKEKGWVTGLWLCGYILRIINSSRPAVTPAGSQPVSNIMTELVPNEATTLESV